MSQSYREVCGNAVDGKGSWSYVKSGKNIVSQFSYYVHILLRTYFIANRQYFSK